MKVVKFLLVSLPFIIHPNLFGSALAAREARINAQIKEAEREREKATENVASKANELFSESANNEKLTQFIGLNKKLIGTVADIDNLKIHLWQIKAEECQEQLKDAQAEIAKLRAHSAASPVPSGPPPPYVEKSPAAMAMFTFSDIPARIAKVDTGPLNFDNSKASFDELSNADSRPMSGTVTAIPLWVKHIPGEIHDLSEHEKQILNSLLDQTEKVINNNKYLNTRYGQILKESGLKKITEARKKLSQ